MILRYLPSDSAVAARNFAGDDRWGKQTELLAAITDYLQILNHNFLRANGAKQLDKPEFVERPNIQLELF